MDNHTKSSKGDADAPTVTQADGCFWQCCVSRLRARRSRRLLQSKSHKRIRSRAFGRPSASCGALWSFFHPFLAYRDIDWDGALVKAIPASRRRARPQITAWPSTGCSRCWDPATRVEMMSHEPRPARRRLDAGGLGLFSCRRRFRRRRRCKPGPGDGEGCPLAWSGPNEGRNRQSQRHRARLPRRRTLPRKPGSRSI